MAKSTSSVPVLTNSRESYDFHRKKITSIIINAKKYADSMINADKNADSMFNTKNF